MSRTKRNAAEVTQQRSGYDPELPILQRRQTARGGTPRKHDEEVAMFYLAVHSREGDTIAPLHLTLHTTTRKAADAAIQNFDVPQWYGSEEPPEYPPCPFVFQITADGEAAKLVWYNGEEQLEGYDSVHAMLAETDPAALDQLIAELRARREALTAAAVSNTDALTMNQTVNQSED